MYEDSDGIEDLADDIRAPKRRRTTLRTQRRHDKPDPTPAPTFDDGEAEPLQTFNLDSNDRPRTSKPRNSTPKRSPRRHKKHPGDRRWQIFFGALFSIIGVVLAFYLFSHLHAAAFDQSKVLNQDIAQMAAKGGVANTGGPVGAWTSNLLFAEGLGLGAFVVALYFIVLGACMITNLRFNFWTLTFKSLLLAVTVSLVMGWATYESDSALTWGGTHGHYAVKYLLEAGGWPTAVAVCLLLVVASVCLIYYPIKAGYGKAAKLMPRRQKNAPQQQNVAVTTAIAKTQKLAENISQKEPQAVDNQAVAFKIDNDESEPVADPKSEPGFEVTVATLDDASDDLTDAPAPSVPTDKYDHRADLSHYKMPTLDLLDDRPVKQTVDMDEQQSNKDRIVKTLGDYKISVASIKATVGPTVTLYEIVPTEGIRIAQIKRLEDDIAMSLSAAGIRIIAPMPGKGTVGIEVPNNDPQTVSMRSVLASRKFQESKKALPLALGATIANDVFVTDLASMPHALVAGATGQGKSVGLNAIIASLLYKKHPSELKFVLIDPKMVEFSLYAKLAKHYLAVLPEGCDGATDEDDPDPIITDSSRVLGVLNSLCVEMDQRYLLLKKAGVRDIEAYNGRFTDRRLNPEAGHRYLPYIVVIIDEFSDLILAGGKEIEVPVTRITQKARAVGIHMIIATQRPSTNVLTGLIKANCPARIAFRVLQMVDSRTILDRPGADHLIGRGDMLYSAGGAMERMQCAFISTDEVERICDFVNDQVGYPTPYILPDPMLAAQTDGSNGASSSAGGGLDRDPLFDEAARFTVAQSTASTSSLQRRYQIGYNRAGKIMDQMEAAGIVGPASGSKPRAILVDPQTIERLLTNR